MGNLDDNIKRLNQSEEPEEEILKIIDEESAKMDKYLMDQLIRMRVVFPEGSMDAEIDINGRQDDSIAYYLLLRASSTVITNMVKSEMLDPDKVNDMIDGMTELLKHDIADQIKGSEGEK